MGNKLVERAWRNQLDPFMGSGTTDVAAVKLGRKVHRHRDWAKYFDIALLSHTNAPIPLTCRSDRPSPKQEGDAVINHIKHLERVPPGGLDRERTLWIAKYRNGRSAAGTC